MVQRLPFLFLCVCACAAKYFSCDWYPSPQFRNVGMKCSGPLVKEVPSYLRRTLQILLLNGTAISSLDNSTFQERNLPDLRILHVTGGALASVRKGAFCNLPALTMLYLDYNQLELLDVLSFNCSQNLQTVSLVGNPRLRHLLRLVSPSVKHLYLDGCGLASIDVSTVEGLTALEVLSLTENPDLHCPSVKSQFKRARDNLLVICEDSAGDIPSPVFPDDKEITSEKSFTEQDYTITSTKKYSSDDKERATEKPHNEPDSTIEDDDTTADTAFATGVAIGVITGVFAVTLIIIVSYFVYKRYRRRNSISNLRSDNTCEQPLNECP